MYSVQFVKDPRQNLEVKLKPVQYVEVLVKENKSDKAYSAKSSILYNVENVMVQVK